MAELTLPARFPFDDPALLQLVAPMRIDDVEQIMPIEANAFSAPWPASAYRYELAYNDLATYLVLKQRKATIAPKTSSWFQRHPPSSAPSVLAYGGFWLMVDEAHISTIAVHPDWRGQSLGEWMLAGLIEAALLRRAAEITLEVRISNMVAQNLYRKYMFIVVGERKKYYHDNNEDALIMTTPRVDNPDFVRRFAELKSQLGQKLRGK
ncbi:MAG: ribosomal protein S18-alanine N-acetyltransferase [Anaerolineae bacterium]|nr:ribosomal protein S18-alanine N-acetyltransferase [Anaerolineae bacterium]